MNFALRIISLRDENHLTQSKLAQKLEVSSSTVAMWETDNRIPPASMLSKIADYFDVTVDYLLGRTDEPKGGLIVPPILQSPDVRVAFHGGIEGLTQRDLDELARMAELLKKKNTENK